MKNEDNQCFWWCIASWQNSAKTHPEKTTEKLREKFNALDKRDIESPVAVGVNVYAKI